MFAPTLTSMTHSRKNCCYICADCTITYENGAQVNTAFLTNLEPPEIMIKTEPELKRLTEEADAKARKERKPPELPSYKYPPEVVSIALISALARHDIPISLRRDELEYIPALDSQRQEGKTLFGGGFLTSYTKGAELEEARRQEWGLSRRELAVIEELERRR